MAKCARCGAVGELQESLVPGVYTCGPGLCMEPLTLSQICPDCDGTGETVYCDDISDGDFEDCDACDGTGLEVRA